MSRTRKVKGSTPPVIRPDAERPTESKRQRRSKARAKARRSRCPVCGHRMCICTSTEEQEL